MKQVIRGLMVFALLGFLLASGHPAQAAGGTVIAGDLENPRGVAIGDDGTIYVAEGGSGGDKEIKLAEGTQHYGNSGQITMIAPDGSHRVLASGFFSMISDEGEVAGLSGLIYGNGALWGVTAAAATAATTPPGSGALLRIDPHSGAVRQIADIGAYEKAHNPGGFAVDSDPYGLALDKDGHIFVADAGANVIYHVDPANGAIELTAVIPGIAIPAPLAPPGGNPARGGALDLDPVPTDLAIGPDETLYISLLSGGPFPTGAAKIVRIGADGEFGDAALGLTMLTDVELGADGSLYAVQFAEFNVQTTPPGFVHNSGRIWRIRPTGQREVVADGLLFPNKLTFDHKGNLYVTSNSIIPHGGLLMRYNGVGNGGAMPGMPITGNPSPLTWPLFGLVALLLLGLGVGLRRRALK